MLPTPLHRLCLCTALLPALACGMNPEENLRLICEPGVELHAQGRRILGPDSRLQWQELIGPAGLARPLLRPASASSADPIELALASLLSRERAEQLHLQRFPELDWAAASLHSASVLLRRADQSLDPVLLLVIEEHTPGQAGSLHRIDLRPRNAAGPTTRFFAPNSGGGTDGSPPFFVLELDPFELPPPLDEELEREGAWMPPYSGGY